MSDKLDKAVAAVLKAVKRLDAPQGMVARRNARHAVMSALGKCRTQMDKDYPCIRRKPRPRQKVWQPRKGYVDLVALGNGRLGDPDLLAAIAEAKVPLQVRLPNSTGGLVKATQYWVPKWVAELVPDVAALRAAKSSRSKQQAASAAFLLKQSKL